jgi:LacI family transcriptional regulator
VKILEYPKGDFFIPVEYINELIKKHSDVDGVFAISDMLAGVVIQQLNRLGKNVPKDVSVIGFDGVKNYWNTSYEVSSIKQPIEEIAEVLVKMLINRINGKICKNIVLPVSFIEGNTL